MLVLFLFLWTMAAILIITDPKSEATRWACLTAFFGGLGGLGVVFREDIIPYFQTNITQDPLIIDKLRFVGLLSVSLSHYLSPYALLIYAICFSNIFKENWEKERTKVKLLLLIPPILMYILFPVYPAFKTSYPVLTVWVAPYVLMANFLMIYSYLKTKDRRVKIQKLLTCIIVSPATLTAMNTNYVLPALGILDVYVYNMWAIALQFVVFLFFSIREGAMGVKLTFERQNLDRTMKALTSGTSILNHTIKNEVIKISMCMDNIKHSISTSVKDNPVSAEIDENIKIVLDSTSYLGVMINKIQSQIKDIDLEEEKYCLGKIVDKAVDMVSPFIKGKNINIIKNYDHDICVSCDNIHLHETLSNILNNSIEAINLDGEIKIDIYENSKSIIISSKDNGAGISKDNLPFIKDPFFSTKTRTQNFGLGLLYCNSVMQKHGGSLDVQSEEGVGTTVFLNFPAKRAQKKKLISRSGVYNI